MIAKPRTERVPTPLLEEVQDILENNPSHADIGRACDLLNILIGYLRSWHAPDEDVQEMLTGCVNELAAQGDDGLDEPVTIYRALLDWINAWEADPELYSQLCRDSAFADLFGAISFTAERISNLANHWMESSYSASSKAPGTPTGTNHHAGPAITGAAD